MQISRDSDTNQTHVRNVAHNVTAPCYKSYIRSIEHPFEKGFPMNSTTATIISTQPGSIRTAPDSNPRAERASEQIRLTRRGRVVLGLVGTMLLILAWMTLGGGSADASTDSAASATAVVVIQPGENLWAIARSIAPETDPREMILRIRELNDLGADHVYPGQSIVVPVVQG
jgi:predicted small integral membrane protein